MTDSEDLDQDSIPDDERMTDAEFRVVREYLGVPQDWLAAYLGVTERTVRRWEAGTSLIPDGVRLAIEDLEARTGEFVSLLIESILDVPDPVVVTYRSDEHYHAAHPDQPWPASWHRAVVARLAQEIPALGIEYAAE